MKELKSPKLIAIRDAYRNQGGQFRNATSYSYTPGYTYPGLLPTELWRKPTIGTPAIDQMFKVIEGIRTDDWLVLVGNLEKVLKASTGCSPTYTTAGTFSDRKLTVGKFEANQQWCKSDFISTASALSADPSFVKNGLDGYNVSDAVRSVWMGELVDAIRRDIWRIILFGNTASGNADYNVIKGLFVQLYDNGSAYCVKRVGNDLPNNNTTLLTADQALNALKALHTGVSNQLKMLPISEKVFWVSGSMYENLLASYESKTAGATEIQFRMLFDQGVPGSFTKAGDNVFGGGNEVPSFNVPQLYYRGIPVIPLYLADNYLQDSHNPWYQNIGHFAIYTTNGKSRFANLVVGTEVGSDLDRVDMFYDQRTKTTFAQHESRFGCNFVQCDLTGFYD